MIARLLFGIPYIFSSGDAVSAFLSARMPLLRPVFALYERLLYRLCSGFIGWTPYLVGRALSSGAPYAMTAPGWAPFSLSTEERRKWRCDVRGEFGIPGDALVIGIVGSLIWNHRVGYCYGYELVEAARLAKRDDLFVLVVGDGDGKAHLEGLAGAAFKERVLLVGSVAQRDTVKYLAAMDLASLPQSMDQVGSFRYTTKISEYLEAGLPVVTGMIPLSYDLDSGWLWRLPGKAPWHRQYIESLAELLARMSWSDIARKQSVAESVSLDFDRDRQISRVTEFISDLFEVAPQRPASETGVASEPPANSVRHV